MIDKKKLEKIFTEQMRIESGRKKWEEEEKKNERRQIDSKCKLL